VAGTKLADMIPSSADTRLTNHPVVNSVISGVTQFLTARAALGPVGAGKDLGKAGLLIREMSLGAFVDAFAFNPDDPLIGDVAKHLGMGENWFTKLDSIENYKEEWQKRTARAGEGAVLGLGIELIAKAYRAVKAYKAGDIK